MKELLLNKVLEKIHLSSEFEVLQEMTVIGSILANNELWFDANQQIRPYMFLDPRNRAIANKAWAAMEKSGRADRIAIGASIENEEEGVHYQSLITHYSWEEFEGYCKEIRARFINVFEVENKQESLNLLLQKVSAEEVQQREEAERVVYDTQNAGKSKEDSLDEMITRIEKAMLGDGTSGIPTGFSELDKLTGGWQNGLFYLIAGRPGMGKTWISLKHMLAAVEAGYKVLFISLEMTAVQLNMRVASYWTGVPVNKMRNGTLEQSDFEAIKEARLKMQGLDYHIEENCSNLSDLISTIRRYKRRQGIDLVIIDYIQYVEAAGANSNEKMTIVSNKLAQLAKQIDVPFIVLSQLSRAVEVRGGSKMPQLSDIRDSGSLEQNAYFVMFLYRPEYYGIIEDPEGVSLKGVVQLIVAKHRDGELKTIRAKMTQGQIDEDDFEIEEKSDPVIHVSKMANDEDIPF